MGRDAVRTLIDAQKALMVAVSTGGPRIEDKQAEYTNRQREIKAALRPLGLTDPNPHDDLWAWYGYYSENFAAGSGGGYVARRNYVRELYKPVLDALDHLDERQLGTGVAEDETGWERVDSQISQLRERYATARTVEDYQAVGLLCRDIFVSLADASFDEEEHLPEGQDAPTSAKERLRLVVAGEAAGASQREVRKALNAVLDLANTVQHDRAARDRQVNSHAHLRPDLKVGPTKTERRRRNPKKNS